MRIIDIGCPCREEGSDGTDKHNESSGRHFLNPGKTEIVEEILDGVTKRDYIHRISPCANHVKNYVLGGFEEESSGTKD